MKLIDCRCIKCGAVRVDVLLRDIDATLPRCHAVLENYPEHGQSLVCGAKMERVHLPTQRGTVIQDSIEGGLEVSNGICWPDGSPRRFYSKSEMAKAAAEKGLINYVTHIGRKGSDRSDKTSRWI